MASSTFDAMAAHYRGKGYRVLHEETVDTVPVLVFRAPPDAGDNIIILQSFVAPEHVGVDEVIFKRAEAEAIARKILATFTDLPKE